MCKKGNKCPPKMKKKHFKFYYILINLFNFDISVTPSKIKASEITGIGRNTIAKVTDRFILNGFLVKYCKEQ
jgi:hypothetical protein